MRTFKEKIKSRKFLAACAGVVTGLAMAFGLDESTISNVAGAVVSMASLVAYIITEGKIDAENAKYATEDIYDGDDW